MKEVPGLVIPALKPGAKAVALSELSASELLAGMSAETRAAMATALAAEPDEEEQPEPTAGKNKAGKSKKDMKPDEGCDDAAAHAGTPAYAAGIAAENGRVMSVLKSEHFKGREAQAAVMLGNTKLSADEITSMLAAAPVASAEGSDGKLMMEALTGANANLGSDADQDPPSPKADNYGWGYIHAEIAEQRKA